MDPIIDVTIIPTIPVLKPMILDMISGESKVNARPTKARIPVKVGKMFMKEFQAFLRAIFVFYLSFMKDISERQQRLYIILCQTLNPPLKKY